MGLVLFRALVLFGALLHRRLLFFFFEYWWRVVSSACKVISPFWTV
ncbi:hypothetical protein XFLM_00210 [Xylella fastidiosa subsp. fastidiosa GB514]|nr:hypothetical protein XFLM_00210 [Xylella fastidiosa subsp. fastidiosa GB514]